MIQMKPRTIVASALTAVAGGSAALLLSLPAHAAPSNSGTTAPGSASSSSHQTNTSTPVSKPTAVETPEDHQYSAGACYTDGTVDLPAGVSSAGAPTCGPTASGTPSTAPATATK
jgi:hypothetical protein